MRLRNAIETIGLIGDHQVCAYCLASRLRLSYSATMTRLGQLMRGKIIGREEEDGNAECDFCGSLSRYLYYLTEKGEKLLQQIKQIVGMWTWG